MSDKALMFFWLLIFDRLYRIGEISYLARDFLKVLSMMLPVGKKTSLFANGYRFLPSYT